MPELRVLDVREFSIYGATWGHRRSELWRPTPIRGAAKAVQILNHNVLRYKIRISSNSLKYIYLLTPIQILVQPQKKRKNTLTDSYIYPRWESD